MTTLSLTLVPKSINFRLKLYKRDLDVSYEATETELSKEFRYRITSNSNSNSRVADEGQIYLLSEKLSTILFLLS